jgi:hypothetical protein
VFVEQNLDQPIAGNDLRHFIVIFMLLAVHGSISAQVDQPATMQPKLSSVPAQPKPPSAIKRAVPKSGGPAVSAAPVKLTDEELELAKRVHVGLIPCEMGSSVSVIPHEKEPGFFRVKTKTASFLMHPVSSRTGAIRLEDAGAGALWLQLGNKSMLMSQKLGQRLADECINPEQAVMAEMLKKNPAPSILDAVPPEPTK